MKLTSKLGYWFSAGFFGISIVLILVGLDVKSKPVLVMAFVCALLGMIVSWIAKYKELEERQLAERLRRRESDKRFLYRTADLLVYLEENYFDIKIGDEAIYVDGGERLKVTTVAGEEKFFLVKDFEKVEMKSQYLLVFDKMLISFLYGKENSALVFYKK